MSLNHIDSLSAQIKTCRICAQAFANTATGHNPRPVLWFGPNARVLIAGQAPGARVHISGQPFTDASGERLREWMDVDTACFYDTFRIAIVPMAFCFPGHNSKGADLPPPPICASTWRKDVMATLPNIRLVLLVGGHAIRWHLGETHVTNTVANWRIHANMGFWPLPHPSWRNTGWLTKNPWFVTDLLPALRRELKIQLEFPE